MPAADPLLHWLALRAVPGVGVILFQRLLEKFTDPGRVFAAAPAELLQVKGVRPPVVRAIKDFAAWDRCQAVLARLRRGGVETITWHDARYPRSLRQIPYAPPFFFLKGSLLPEDECAVALVGTRQPTAYGRRVAAQLATELARRGITVISGLARGIDTIAQRAVVTAGGRTLGILGCGLDFVYPPENKDLYRQVVAQGALITEFPLGTPPEAHNFPIRNRLISGLARAVVIIEAGDQSGALITANYALEQGREVLAVPGPIDSPASVGTNRLLQQGAKPLLSLADLLEELGARTKTESQKVLDVPGARTREVDPLVELLSTEPQHLDEIIAASGQSAAVVLSRLTFLELQGLIRELPGKFYVLAA